YCSGGIDDASIIGGSPGAANRIFANAPGGFGGPASNLNLVSNAIYGNGTNPDFCTAPGGLCLNCKSGNRASNFMGYTAAGVLATNTGADLLYRNQPGSAVLKNSWINIPGIDFDSINAASTYLVNYSSSSGILQIFGDYQVSGTTLTLDYASQL